MVSIFYYHSVGGPPPQTLDQERFLKHLELIQKHRYRAVTVSEALGDPTASKVCALAFDDGLMDNFEVVFPLLREFGFQATFYVVPGYDQATRWVNPATGEWSDEPQNGFTIGFESMKSEHRRELHSQGMEIGCHTMTHRKLTTLSPDQLEGEVAGAKSFLEEELGAPVDTFCYPNGRFNPRVYWSVRRAGFLGACSTIPGYLTTRSVRHLLPRFLVEDPDCFEQVLLGRAFRPCSWLPPLLRRLR